MYMLLFRTSFHCVLWMDVASCSEYKYIIWGNKRNDNYTKILSVYNWLCLSSQMVKSIDNLMPFNYVDSRLVGV